MTSFYTKVRRLRDRVVNALNPGLPPDIHMHLPAVRKELDDILAAEERKPGFKEPLDEGAPLPPWTPFEQGYLPPMDPVSAQQMADAAGVPVEVVLAQQEDERLKALVFMNSRYQVNIRRMPGRGPLKDFDVAWLSIKRRDKQPLGTERFRDLQRIKNELIHPEAEAVELYPAESRMVDTANQYHLWVVLAEGFHWPIGFEDGRIVSTRSAGGSIQKPFEE